MPLFKMVADEAPSDLEPDAIFEIISASTVINTLITEFTNKLFTVCAIFHEYPYV